MLEDEQLGDPSLDPRAACSFYSFTSIGIDDVILMI